MTALAILLGVLEGFSATIGGIWLAVLGKWGPIGVGLAIAVVGTFVLVRARRPGRAFAWDAFHFVDQGYTGRFYFFLLLSNLCDSAVIVVWSVSDFYYFVSSSDQSSLIPFLLWSFGIANVPFEIMAEKALKIKVGSTDVHARWGPVVGLRAEDVLGSMIEAWSRQIGYVAMMVMVLLHARWINAITVFVLIIVVGNITQFAATIQIRRSFARPRETP